METIKDISSIIGVILSIISLVTICSKGGRVFLKSVFKKNTKELVENDNKQDEDISKIRDSLYALQKSSEKNFKHINESLSLVMDFSKQQCRNIIKNIYYRYKDGKKIPLYERKTADKIYELYTTGYHANSYMTLLYEEIIKWEIDNGERDLEEDD